MVYLFEAFEPVSFELRRGGTNEMKRQEVGCVLGITEIEFWVGDCFNNGALLR